jgi:NAD-dependent deacetylase
MLDPKLKDFARKAFRRGKAVCFTGAGISLESGIPTFRGKGGLWERYDPELFATEEGLLSVLNDDPRTMGRFLADLYSVLLAARPNPGHEALAEMERRGMLAGVITQNVDDLHRLAGSRRVFELHGNAFRARCVRCAKTQAMDRGRLEAMAASARSCRTKAGLLRLLSGNFPRCGCGGRFRTDVVLFGEPLPQDQLAGAYALLEDCEALLVVGSSLTVYPAASLPAYAKQRGAALIEINSEAARILPELMVECGPDSW